MALTEEQKKRIEQNRLEALRKRAEKEKIRAQAQANAGTVASSGSRSAASSGPGPKQAPSASFVNKPVQVPTVKPTVPSVPVRVAVKFILKSKDRFEMSFPYNPVIVEVCRAIPGSNFDSKTRNWHFELQHYRNLLSNLTKLKQTNNIELDLLQGIPEFVIQALLKETKRPKSTIDLSAVLPKRLFEALYPFQKDGVAFAISRNGRCLIGDDMGLGKTIQAIAISYYFRDDWPLLIVCPSSLRFQWKRSIGEWLDCVREDIDIDVVVDGRKDIPVNRIVIISYDLLLRVKPDTANSFKSIILDESHFIKNDAAQRTKTALKLIKACKRVLLLSGTPALSRPMELFTQLQAVDPKTFAKKHDFGMRYCDGKATQWGYDYRGTSNPDELRILLETTIMIRRLKVDVLQELPPKRRAVVMLDITLPQKAKQLMASFKSQVQATTVEELNRPEQRNIVFQWYSSTAEVKKEPVCKYVCELVEQDKKFICFAHHKVMLDSICSVLEEQRVSYIRIDGSTPSECRQECCDYFQNQEKCKVAVIGITSAGMGITLTAAQLVVFAELYFNPGVLTQAEDRAHRIGQKDSVLIQYLIAPATVDDHIWPLINQKFKVLNKVGLTKDNFSEANLARKAAKKSFYGKIDKFLSKRPRDDESDNREAGDFDFESAQASQDPVTSEDSFLMEREETLLTDDEEFKFNEDDDDLLIDDFNLKLNDSIANVPSDPNFDLNENDFLSDDE
ncbi:SWI/SNF-related matrix-associated actin-dependent regulator of chromatin subfamily A-like protein 1 [Tetranychus urticae]|uniref:SWI/SNF-related matrix-associated actin-dependent regulator of chromatin subfamily A-like protein 1 n=1 Tax=Tetranychus urticae TaxID=32264 RepID=T1KAS8_TETUR|nr:SWI/SNF-related matrix-associated actin-dependent regulator of chromatin subfamily A-like protein 1 [Tetranychus urticae]